MTSRAEELAAAFDAGWDLTLEFDGFHDAVRDLGIAPDDPSGLGRLEPADRLIVARCVVDMCDRLYDLTTAGVWEPRLAELVAAAGGEPGARAWDALGRVSYRRGEYVAAADRFQRALGLVQDSGLRWLHADVASDWLRADDERLRLIRPSTAAERLRRYDDALAIARGEAPDAAAVRPSDGVRAVGAARGLSNVLHNLAVLLARDNQLDRALECHEEALAINQALGDRYRLGQTLLNEALLHERRYRKRGEPAELERAVALLQRLVDDPAWPRGRCLALQNLARISQRVQGDGEAANRLYARAWRTYLELAGPNARDTAFEEWTLLEWVDVTPEDELPARFRSASDTFRLMRAKLRHVLFRRSYAERVIGVLERGLPSLDDAEEAAGSLGTWSAQEIADLTPLVAEIDRQFSGADFTELDRRVSDSLLEVRRAAPPSDDGRHPLTDRELRALMPALRARHAEYLRRIELANLRALPAPPWTVASLRAVLPPDAAAVAYFWPRDAEPSAYIITADGVRVTPLPAGDLRVDSRTHPEARVRSLLHQHLVEPWLDGLLDAGIRSVYLVPYGPLFPLPIHCAQPEPGAPILLRHPDLDRVLYAVSLQQLAESLRGRFGAHGDAVEPGRGLAVLDPAGDLTRARSVAVDRLLETVERLRASGSVATLAGHAATHRGVLDALGAARWWFHLGHGGLPLTRKAGEELRAETRGLQEEAQIGAVLELADGVLEDLDILLRCPTRELEFCVLCACVSAGMDVGAGNEIAGFLRALKVRGCGPAVLAFWWIERDPCALLMDRLLRVLHRDRVPVALSDALTDALDDAERTETGLFGPGRPNSGMFGIYV